MIKTITTLLAVCCLAVLPARADLWQDLASYEFGDASDAPDKLDELVTQTPPGQRGPIEKKLIEILQSQAATSTAKGYTCRMLQRIGTADSVPALAALLGDKVLSHYARLALQRMESIPQAGEALRSALAGAPDSVKPGILGSIAERRDRQAVTQIAKLLASSDQAVAAGAIRALGKIGGKEALAALAGANVPAKIKAVHLEAMVSCAASLAGEGDSAGAYAALDKVYQTSGSSVHRVAALGEMLQVDGAKASPIVVGLIKGKDSPLRDGALRLVVTLKSDKLTAALIGSLPALDAAARAELVELLGKRGDAAALQAVVGQLKDPDKAVRQAAVAAVGELGGAAQVKALLEQAQAGEAAALDALAQSGAEGIDAALIALLEGGAFKAEAIKALAMRGCRTAGPQAVKLAADPSAEVRLAAWGAMADLATEKEIDSLMKLLLAAKDEKERSAAATAVAAICSEAGDRNQAFDIIAGHYASGGDNIKLLVLEMGPSFGTGKALELEREAVKSGNAEHREAAVRAMAAWPNPGAANDLLKLAREGKSNTEKIVALRGYIQVSSKGGSDAEKAARYKAAIDLTQRREDKWLLISMLKECRHINSLRVLKSYFADAEAAAEAQLTAIDVARRMRVGKDRDEVIAIIQPLAESGKNKNVMNRAKDCLANLKK